MAERFKDFFVNIVPSLKISPKENYKTDVGNDNKRILNSEIKKSKLLLLIMFLVKKFLMKLGNHENNTSK